MTLLDTCIVIDVLRGRASALEFVDALAETPALSVITATELVAGVRDARERRIIDRLLDVYLAFDVGVEIAALAGDYVRQYGPSHGVDPIDALIAATVKLHELDFATLNVKHFPMIKGLKRAYTQ